MDKSLATSNMVKISFVYYVLHFLYMRQNNYKRNICLISITSFILCQIVLWNGNHALQMFRNRKYDQLIYDLCFLVSILFGAYVTCCIYHYTQQIKEIFFKCIGNPKLQLRSKLQLQSYLTQFNWFTKAWYISTSILLGAYLVLQATSNCNNKDNFTCGLLLPCIFPINVYERRFKNIINICYAFVFHYLSLGAMNVILFLVQLKYSVNLHYTEIIQSIRKLKFIVNKKHRYAKFSCMVKASLRIEHIWKKIDFIYKWPIMAQLLVSTVVISLTISTIRTSIHWFIFFLLCLQAFNYLLATLAFANIGEQLRQISAQLQLELFNAMPWDGDVKFAKAMVFFHMKFQIPIVLHVGNFMVHSNMIVLQVFNTIYSLTMLYYNQLKRINS